MKRRWIWPAAAVLLLCSACSFLPKEEQLPEAPVLHSSQDETYTQVAVTRGSVVRTETVDCRYQPAVEEILSFTVDNQVIAAVYVAQGDQVKAGDLIAELDNEALHDQMKAQQHTLDAMNLQVQQTQEKLNLYYERCAALNEAKAADPGRYAAASEAADLTCWELSKTLDRQNRALEIEQLAMQELEEKLAARQLYATMDGTVRTAITVNPLSPRLSTAGQTVCTISDLDSGSFRGKTAAGLFHPGDTVNIVYDKQDHAAVVSEVTAHKDGKEEISFRLEVPDAALGTGTTGKITVEAARRDDVLCLPSKTVKRINASTLVYYIDETGVKNSKIIEIGLEGDTMVEIKSGLEEGEVVIR